MSWVWEEEKIVYVFDSAARGAGAFLSIFCALFVVRLCFFFRLLSKQADAMAMRTDRRDRRGVFVVGNMQPRRKNDVFFFENDGRIKIKCRVDPKFLSPARAPCLFDRIDGVDH